MAHYVATIDEVTGKIKKTEVTLADLGGSGEVETNDDFDVGVGGQSTFVMATGTVTADSIVDVYVNGRLMREGLTYDFSRNAANNQVVFNYTVPESAWVRVRIKG